MILIAQNNKNKNIEYHISKRYLRQNSLCMKKLKQEYVKI